MDKKNAFASGIGFAALLPTAGVVVGLMLGTAQVEFLAGVFLIAFLQLFFTVVAFLSIPSEER